MKTFCKTIIGLIIAACAFVALGEMEESSLAEIIVSKSVAAALLLFSYKCWCAVDEE